MSLVRNSKGTFSVTAYQGDAKTLLAFNLDKADARNLAGFTIACTPGPGQTYYIFNQLQFKKPADHAQDSLEPPNSSLNAPIHKFRWLHMPGLVHQGLKPFMGRYTYTVTPRYFDQQHSLLPLDPSQSVSVDINVVPFRKGNLRLGFARGFTQSQAFVNHFGKKALIRPKENELLFDTTQLSGANAGGEKYTFADEYQWLGFTAREQVFELLNELSQDATLHLDMFAYDLNEPDLMKIVLDLAAGGRARVILDNAALHHNTKKPKLEDQFEQEFNKRKKGNSAILRGKFGRYAHDKVLIVSSHQGPLKVLTGSTNFSVTGLYVNSNHVLVFEEPGVAAVYTQVFEEAWQDGVSKAAFQKSNLSKNPSKFATPSVPPMEITFSPHTMPEAATLLQAVANRIALEGTKKTSGSVLFAVMELDHGTSPVYTALNALHENQSIFSFGISDNPSGIVMYKPGTATGVLVTGKPASTVLPKPFSQVPGIGFGHQVHHKFVVCGFNQPDAVVYCGSSNLANGGEQMNGDNLLAIHDTDVATVFAIEALGLVDHFNFLDKYATSGKGSTPSKKKTPSLKKPSSLLAQAAVSAGWFLSTSDRWTEPYFDPKDLKYADRILFGA
jgi:phosphatidylserine/phosphatidylglycerophosphate/cardiolipin synthase-like enzyme